MRVLITRWLARWGAAFITWVSALVARLFGPLLLSVAIAGRGMTVHPTTGRPSHHHTAEEHAVPGRWQMVSRVATVARVVGAVLAFAHRIRRPFPGMAGGGVRPSLPTPNMRHGYLGGR